MNKMKGTIKYVIILTLSIILCGCMGVELNSHTIINENESGSIKLQVAYDNIIASKLSRDVVDHKWARENGYFFNKYKDGNTTIEELVYPFKNVKELEEKINSSGLAAMTYTTKLQNGEKVCAIKLAFNKSNIDKLIKNNIGNDEKIYNYINNLKICNEVSVPGQILISNASENINESTRKWTYKLNQIDDNTVVLFSYKFK